MSGSWSAGGAIIVGGIKHVSLKSDFFILSLAFFTAASPYVALADKVTCESEGYDKTFCDMDTHGGVHVYKNLSKTDCVKGENWDESRHGVWVKGGCRAEFVSGEGQVSGHDGYHHHEDSDRGDYRREPPPLVCPPGTHPSTRRCTKEERRKGCKDYGANDGTGRGCSNFNI
jgi:hypothetical protein